MLKCPYCISQKPGNIIINKSKIIIPKGPREWFVLDGWKLHSQLANEMGFKWIIDEIDHFSKFVMSYPIEINNGENTLLCFKQYCQY